MAKTSTGGTNRWTEREGRAAIAAWERSGLGAAAFARSRGVDVQRLFWWRRRLETGGAAPAPTPAKAPGLVPLVAVSREVEREPRCALVVTTPAGVRIEVREVDASTAAWVASLVGEVGR